jgi:hypothetical protein
MADICPYLLLITVPAYCLSCRVAHRK